jgi:hypothetical protein
MVDEPFTDPEEIHEDWADGRMTDPEEEEWDLDVVVLDERVEYVDLRIKPELLVDFVDCLIQDAADDRAEAVLAAVAERNGIELQ